MALLGFLFGAVVVDMLGENSTPEAHICEFPQCILVRTRNGIVLGEHIHFENSGKAYSTVAFYGIPFGAPPVGRKRFAMPEPVQPWSGVFNATYKRPPCAQRNTYMPKNYVIDASNTTEDCLHINVWVPGRCVNHTRRRAVVFWLFGGSFVSGGNSYDFYDGRFLAGLGGVVVAVPNYRVASFGFLNSGTGHVPGNMGLHDLLLALRWLQDNIESFGGDTERILVAGQSAGAIAASLLMASEHRNLFRRAYLMSGTLRTPLPDNDGYNARRNFAQFVADAGCKAGKIADSVHCLREANTTAILEASKRAALSLMPNVRGRVFQSHLEIRSREDAAPYKLEVLMSSTLSEGRAFFEMLLPAFVANADKITSSMLKSTFPYFFNSLSDSILDVAIGLLGTLYDLEDLERVGWTELIGDALFRCPTRAFAQELTHFGSTVYYHEYVPKPSFTVFGGNYATHSDDVPILFGYPFLYPHLATDEERQTSHRMIMTLSNFAKNGSVPRLANGSPWPLFREESDYAVVEHTHAGYTLSTRHCDCFVSQVVEFILPSMRRGWGWWW